MDIRSTHMIIAAVLFAGLQLIAMPLMAESTVTSDNSQQLDSRSDGNSENASERDISAREAFRQAREQEELKRQERMSREQARSKLEEQARREQRQAKREQRESGQAAMVNADRDSSKPVVIATDDASLFVDYDNATDRLVVKAENVMLSQLLTQITYETGIEVIFDDEADIQFSTEVDKPSLEQGLKQVLRGTNYMMRYKRDQDQRLMLLGVLVLPEGESDTANARRLVGVQSEAYNQRKSDLSVQDYQAIDLAKQRWQERYAEFPEDLQAKLIDHVEKRMKREAARKLKREQRKQTRDAYNSKQKPRWENNRQKMLEPMSAAEREQFLQSREQARREVESRLFSNSKN